MTLRKVLLTAHQGSFISPLSFSILDVYTSLLTTLAYSPQILRLLTYPLLLIYRIVQSIFHYNVKVESHLLNMPP